MTYSEKLRDPRWQKKRLEILRRDNFTCVSCSATDKTLHVHHTVYGQNQDPWEYGQSLITLCEDCHAERRIAQENLLIGASRLTNDELFNLAVMLGRPHGVIIKREVASKPEMNP